MVILTLKPHNEICNHAIKVCANNDGYLHGTKKHEVVTNPIVLITYDLKRPNHLSYQQN